MPSVANLPAAVFDVRYAPNSDQILRRSEMTRCAISDIALHGDNGRYGSPGLNGRSFPGGTLSSAIARTIATVM